MKTITIEYRDSCTFMPLLVMKMSDDDDRGNSASMSSRAARYLQRRCGYTESHVIILRLMDMQPFVRGDSHGVPNEVFDFIEENIDELRDGSVLDRRNLTLDEVTVCDRYYWMAKEPLTPAEIFTINRLAYMSLDDFRSLGDMEDPDFIVETVEWRPSDRNTMQCFAILRVRKVHYAAKMLVTFSASMIRNSSIELLKVVEDTTPTVAQQPSQSSSENT